MMIRAVLFDLDGTLLDTAPDLVAALNHVRQGEGLDVVLEQDYRHLVSRGAAGLLTAGLPVANPKQFESHKTRFLEYYRDHLWHKTRPFDGISELLDALEVRGVPWGIVTNKSESLTQPLLKKAGLFKRAACVVCGDTLSESKPHPAPVLLACRILRVTAEHTLMVGDDVRDLEAGRAAGAPTALACYGYVAPDVDEVAYAGSYRIAHPRDLLALLSPTERWV